MKHSDRYLIYGASGTQGGAIARLLVDKGVDVRTITRSEDTAAKLKEQRIEAYIGDLGNIDSLHKAHEGINKVLLNLPVEFDLPKLRNYIKNVIEAAQQANIDLIVVNTSVFVPGQVTEATAVESKRELIHSVKNSGLPFIIVEPIVYLENIMIPGILNNGVLAYPVPVDKPIAWISVDDAAQYHYYALSHPELAGSVIPAPGLEALTGSQLAEHLSIVMGENIHFVSLSLDSFEAALAPMLGETTASGLKGLYNWIGSNTASLPQFHELDAALQADLQLTTLNEWIRHNIVKNIQ